MIKSVKLRIYPNKYQLNFINNTLSCCRYIKNNYIAYNIKEYKENGKFITGYDYSKIVNKLKKTDDEFSWICNYSSKAIQRAMVDVEKSFKEFFKKNRGFPKFKSRKRLNKESYYFTKNSIHYTDNKNIIKLPILKKIRITDSKSLPNINTIISGRIIREYDKYYVLFIYNLDNKRLSLNNTKLGIDLGVKNYAIIYNGNISYKITHYKDYKRYKYYENKINKLMNIISNKVETNYGKLLNEYYDKHHSTPNEVYKNKMKGESYNTSRIRKLFNKIKRYNNKLNNIREDFIKKLINYLTAKTKPNCITIEDLDISDMISIDNNHSLHKLIMYSNFYYFKSHLVDKCKEYGIKLRLLDKYYPSTKKCSICGNKQHISLSDRIFICKSCGYEIDRDINSAINIYSAKDKKCVILNA